LFAGPVDLFFDSASAALPHIQANKVRGIALAGPKRSALIPSVPTMGEAGVKGFDIESGLGLFVPAATPEPVVEKLRAQIKAVVPGLKARFEQTGGNAIDMTPAQTEAFIRAEYDAWTKVIKDAGIKLD
jgi:tripartite-type tricarboxylate transporter receptor subunit TctC